MASSSVHRILSNLEGEDDAPLRELAELRLYIEPPAVEDDRASVQDDAGSDMEGGNVDSLPGAVLRQNGKLRRRTYTRGAAVADSDDEDDEQSNDEDDFTLATLQKRPRRPRSSAAARAQEPAEYEWDESDLPPNPPTPPTIPPIAELPQQVIHPDAQHVEDDDHGGGEAVDDRAGPVGVTPTVLFSLFFTDELLEILRTETVRYAHEEKGDHLFTLTPTDLHVFLAILLVSGYNTVPNFREMWQDPPSSVRNEMVCNSMRRNKFLKIKEYFHTAAAGDIVDGDRLWKLRRLFTHLNTAFLQHAPEETTFSVDEAMVPYFGRHSCKVFIKGKPIRFGYKMWCLCNRDGYLYQFHPCQPNDPIHDKAVGLGASVITHLLSVLPVRANVRVYADRFFSSVKLCKRLALEGIGYTGTVMHNRVADCPLGKQMKELGRAKQRGSYVLSRDANSNVLVVLWIDTRPVLLVSNCDPAGPTTNASRWSQAADARVQVDMPHTVEQYNRYMGGVDRMDQNIGTCRVGIRSKKWYWPLVMFALGTATQNAWQLYRRSPTGQATPLTYTQFVQAIAESTLLRYGTPPEPAGRKPSARGLALADVRRLEGRHYLARGPTQQLCARCRNKTKFRCTRCERALCIDCFEPFHEDNRPPDH